MVKRAIYHNAVFELDSAPHVSRLRCVSGARTNCPAICQLMANSRNTPPSSGLGRYRPSLRPLLPAINSASAEWEPAPFRSLFNSCIRTRPLLLRPHIARPALSSDDHVRSPSGPG